MTSPGDPIGGSRATPESGRRTWSKRTNITILAVVAVVVVAFLIYAV